MSAFKYLCLSVSLFISLLIYLSILIRWGGDAGNYSNKIIEKFE